MNIRQALRRQSDLASQKRGKAPPKGHRSWCGSNAILAMMAGIFAIVCAVEILHG